MMLCMTLLVRDEIDIVRHNIDYHLNRGVDKIIATDNLSVDGTSDVLRDYEKLGVLHYIYEPTDDYSQDLWVTRMANIAREQYAADWVIHTDADEFWWPQQGDFKQVLASVPAATEGLEVERSNFIALQHENPSLPFFEEMVCRQKKSTNPIGRPLPPKVCHRALPGVQLHQGNHKFTVAGWPARTVKTDEFIIWHFQYRGFAEYQRKISLGGAAYERNTRLADNVGTTWRKLLQAERAGELREFYTRQTRLLAQLERQLALGEAVQDTRFRDYMRNLGDMHDNNGARTGPQPNGAATTS